MQSKFKIRKRLNLTKLKVMEKTSCIAGNSSTLMEKIRLVLDRGTIIAGVEQLPLT